ncbi:hypothetical protein ACIA8G_32620 [Lentzea sp. NPDC051213]|uniref:hypothetical protein n=1 Tax=Lentzea sp. NPDC051213 TaxID=3364126 RepID=UPI00379949B0
MKMRMAKLTAVFASAAVIISLASASAQANVGEVPGNIPQVSCDLSTACVTELGKLSEQAGADGRIQTVSLKVSTKGWGVNKDNYLRYRHFARLSAECWAECRANEEKKYSSHTVQISSKTPVLSRQMRHFKIDPNLVNFHSDDTLAIVVQDIDTKALPAWAAAVIAGALTLIVPAIVAVPCLALIPELPVVCGAVAGAITEGFVTTAESLMLGENLKDKAVYTKIIAKMIFGAFAGVAARYLDVLLLKKAISQWFKRGGYWLRDGAKSWWVPTSVANGAASAGHMMAGIAEPVEDALRQARS